MLAVTDAAPDAGRRTIMRVQRRRPDPASSAAARVSGSSETTTYGRGIAMREHQELHTLPSRSFFGKDTNERSCVFKGLQILFSPHRGTLFGQVVVHSCHGTVESITVGSISIGKDIGLQMSDISRVLRYRRF